MIIEQIAIAFFLFTVNSLFLEWPRRFGRIMHNDDRRASGTWSRAGLITKFTSELMLVMSAKMWPSGSSLVG